MENSIRFPHLLKAEFLKNLPLEYQKEILNGCSVLTYDTVKTVLMQGERANGMYIVAHGSVDIVYLGARGQKVFIARFETGRTFGDSETIAEIPCTATCEAANNTVLLFCPKPALFSHLKSTAFVQNMMAEVCIRMATDNALKLVDQTSSVTHRLIAHLQLLSEKTNLINKTQSNLAEMARCSRQTMNKELGKLRDQGIIEIRNRSIFIKDQKKLLAALGQCQQSHAFQIE